MAGFWEIIVSEAATNYAVNPTPQTNTNGYSAHLAGSIARTAGMGRRGVYGLVYTPTANTGCGVSFSFSAFLASLASGVYTASADWKGASGVPYTIKIFDNLSTLLASANFTGTGRWQRVSCTMASAGVPDFMVIVKNNSASTVVCQMDGVQIELADHATTYIDGEQPGCTWSSTAYGSTSERSAQERNGGRAYNLDSFSLYISSLQGVGMPPIKNTMTDYAQSDGARFQNSTALARSVTLEAKFSGASQSNLHSIRKQIIDTIKPDRTSQAAPFPLRYLGTGGETMIINALYDSGFEFGQQSGFNQAQALRVITPDPFWSIDGVEGAALTVAASVTNANYILQRSAGGAWAAMGLGMNNSVECLAIAADKKIYAGGQFSTAGGAGCIRVAVWNPVTSSWGNMAGGCNGTVRAIAIGPDGSVYVGGDFTLANAVANTAYIAKWNGSAWSALGTGMNGAVYSLCFGPDGNLYAGGDFTTAGGVALNRLAKWNGTAWSSVDGGAGANGRVRAMAWGLDGKLYLGGEFTSIAGVAANYIARWDNVAIDPLSTGMSALVRTIAVGLDGQIYAGGGFSTAGGISALSIAAWNGSAWSALGTGLGATCHGITVRADGSLIVTGAFLTAGSMDTYDGLAFWNGSMWSISDVDLPGTATANCAVVNNLGVITLGFTTTGTATAAALTTVTSTGTANSYPVIRLTGPTTGTAKIFQLVNWTTGERIHFNLTINAGETIVFDLRPGAKTLTSSFFRAIDSKVLPGANLTTWRLLTGTNSIGFFAITNSSGTGTVAATIEWTPRHWSVDGGAL